MLTLALQQCVGHIHAAESWPWPNYPVMRAAAGVRAAAHSLQVDSQGNLVQAPGYPYMAEVNDNQKGFLMKVHDNSPFEAQSNHRVMGAGIPGALQQKEVNRDTVSTDERAWNSSGTTSTTTTTSTQPRWAVKLHASGVDIAQIFVSEDSRGAWKTQDAQALATALLKREGLVSMSTACNVCNFTTTPLDQIDCCLQWLQNSVYISDVTQLHPGNPTELNVFLAAEQGFDPSLISFVRGLKLGHPPYIKLLGQLNRIGVYCISQMSGVDPSELVKSMGYSDGDSMHAMLLTKLTEQVDARVAREKPKQPSAQWDAAKLIRRNGLLRGVLISSFAQSTNLQEALQFTPAAAISTEEALGKAVLLQPDAKTAQISMESTSSAKIAKASSMMETFGMSSVNSGSLGVSAGWASISGSISGSSSDSTKNKRGRSISTDLNSYSKEFTKSLYYVEPRRLVVVDPALLQPTPALKKAFRDVEQFLESNESFGYSINHFFRDFGTHTCTKAMLGGWWKLTARESAATAQFGMDMAKEASYALEQAVSLSSSVGATLGPSKVGLSFEGTSKEADSESQKAKSESKRASNTSNIITEVTQEWKGGISGLAADVWRNSLDQSQNWKVIDRYMDSCWGIWRWSDDPQVSKRLCKGWNEGFTREMKKELGEDVVVSPEWSDCEGANYLMGSREMLSGRKKQAQQFYRQQQVSACLNLPGRHIKNGACVINKCYCGEKAVPGETGENCPKDGEMKCRPDQRARCSTMTCPPEYWINSTAKHELCTTPQCSLENDRGKCCQSLKLTDAFMVKVKGGWWISLCGGQKIVVKVLDKDGSICKSGEVTPPGKNNELTIKAFGDHQIQMAKVCIKLKRSSCPSRWSVASISVFNEHVGYDIHRRIALTTWQAAISGGNEKCITLS